jgi:CrcB protein
MIRLLLVAAGGAVGSVARYGVGLQVSRWLGSSWPYGTMTVNIAGGFLMGALVAWLAHAGAAQQDSWRALLGVGVLGGFTTFSAFTLEMALMIEKRAYGQAFTYSAASVLLALAALFAGMLFARRILVA